MSASLVGSEMCIRDRLLPKRGLGTGILESLLPPGGPGDNEVLGGWDPVSYTHLTLPTICSV
eukprot:4305928-Alexandrium_andersonii.AAC.1